MFIGDIMLFLLYGTKDYLINKEIKKICKSTDEFNISKYDLNNDLVDLVIDDCETFSMFGDKKIVIVENANMFTGTTGKDMDIIEKYLNNYNLSTVLIFVVHNEKIDGRKKITSLMKKKGKIIEFNDEINVNSLIDSEFKGYNISSNDIKVFLERVGNNPDIICNEINKIKLFKGNDRNISYDDIINLTVNTIDVDIFGLIDNIVKGNKEKAIEYYHNMLLLNEEPIKLIGLLADQFRIMYQSKELLFKGYSEKSIAETIKVHPYRVKLAIKNGRNYSSDVLLNYLGKLFDVDLGIKTGKLNKDLALELFLLKI